MRPIFEDNYFLVMYAMLAKYNKSRLPRELVVDIKDRCVKVRKQCRQEYAKQSYGKGKQSHLQSEEPVDLNDVSNVANSLMMAHVQRTKQIPTTSS